MLKDDGKVYCDSCEEWIKDEHSIIFIDAMEGSGEFCCWGCIVEWGSEYVEDA